MRSDLVTCPARPRASRGTWLLAHHSKMRCAVPWRLPAAAASSGTATSVSIAVASAEARLARFGFVHFDIPSFEVGIVELTYRVGRFLRSPHLDKTDAFRLSRELVHDDRKGLHLANL